MIMSLYPQATRAAQTYDAELAKAAAKRPSLVYVESGLPVAEGDKVIIRGQEAMVDYFPVPHKPESIGKVTVVFDGHRHGVEYFVSIIGAVWINRYDQGDTVPALIADPIQLSIWFGSKKAAEGHAADLVKRFADDTEAKAYIKHAGLCQRHYDMADLNNPAVVSAAKPTPVAVSKITAKMLKEQTNVRTLSAKGVHFRITTEQEHAKWSAYGCVNLEAGTTYACNSLAEIREWMSLN